MITSSPNNTITATFSPRVMSSRTQVQRFSSELRKDGQRLSNVVMMGMGEPLANYENVMTAIRRMNTELGIGARHITISTVGLAPRIRKLADDPLQVLATLYCMFATLPFRE